MNGEPVRNGHVWIVALVLGVGLVTALNFITIAVLYDAIASSGPGLSDNATQILVSGFSGIIGVLGGYMGYRAAQQTNAAVEAAREEGRARNGGPDLELNSEEG